MLSILKKKKKKKKQNERKPNKGYVTMLQI